MNKWRVWLAGSIQHRFLGFSDNSNASVHLKRTFAYLEAIVKRKLVVIGGIEPP